MRVRVVFKVKNRGGYVPFHHQQLLYQLIKDTVGHHNMLPNNFFNFSGLKGQTKVSRHGLHFYSSRVTLVLSCLNDDFLIELSHKIFENNEIKIGNLILIPKFIEKEEEPSFLNPCKYICISPMVLVNPEYDSFYAKKFTPPDTDIFSDLLYENTMSRMEDSGLYSLEEIKSFYKFQVVPDQAYLKKIREDDKKFARIYTVNDGKRKLELRGYTFPFTLYAPEKVQNFVFKCGIGAYATRGFGMIDIAGTDPIERTVIFEVADSDRNEASS